MHLQPHRFFSSTAIIIALIIALLLVPNSDAGLFDYTEIDDPFSFIFNTKEQLLNRFGSGNSAPNDFWSSLGLGNNNNNNNNNDYNRPCTAFSKFESEPSPGVCVPREQCNSSGGKVEWSSSCLFFKTVCCVPRKVCTSQSSNIVSRFHSDPNHLSANESCSFNLRLRNNVCQVRLDFTKFNLAPPRKLKNNTSYECVDDAFRIADYDNIPSLCGNNTGQHIYLPVKSTVRNNRQRNLRLTVDVEQHVPQTRQIAREWDIEIRQIECPSTTAIRTRRSFLSSLSNEYLFLAPKNCLQYFVGKTGSVRSLNLGGGDEIQGHYVGPSKYAVCFYSNYETCGYRFVFEYFDLNAGNQSKLQFDRDCDNTDYLTFPEARLLDDDNNNYTQFNRLCGSQTLGTNITIISTTPGPFYFTFTTDGLSSNTTEKGFQVHYKRLTSGCD